MSDNKTLNSKVAFVLFQTSLIADGGVRSAQIIVKHFSRIRPVIITQRTSPLTDDLIKLGYEVIIRPISRKPGQSLFANGIIVGCIDLLRVFSSNIWFLFFLHRRNIKVVHCNDVLSFLYFGLGAYLRRAKIIFVLRRSFEPRRPYSRKYILAFRLSDTIITLSKTMKRELLGRVSGLKGVGEKITNIYSGVDRELSYVIDSEEKKSLRRDLGLDGSFYIAYVGAFSPRKGQLEFLKNTCFPLMKKNKSLRFLFVGDFNPEASSYCAECLNFVEQHKLEKQIAFLGGVNNIADWYRVSDLVVLASSSEGLARVMIEALCVGTPVVSFDVTSANEILEEHDCGVVVEKENYPKLAEAIEKIAQDREFAKRLRNNGLRVVAELFDANKCAQHFEDLYGV